MSRSELSPRLGAELTSARSQPSSLPSTRPRDPPQQKKLAQ